MVGLLPGRPTIFDVRREVGAILHKATKLATRQKRATRRLLEAVLKWAGIALLLVACGLLVFLGAVLLVRGAGSILVP